MCICAYIDKCPAGNSDLAVLGVTMITYFKPLGCIAAVVAGFSLTAATVAGAEQRPAMVVAQAQTGDTPTRNTVDLLNDIVTSSTRLPAPANAVKLIDPRALIRPQLRPGSDTQLASVGGALPEGTNLTGAMTVASDPAKLAEETAAARAAITGQPDPSKPAATPEQTAKADPAPEHSEAEHAAEGGHDMAMDGDHDHMMMMPAPNPAFSECVNEIVTVANRTTIYFDSASSGLDKRSREAAFFLASLAQKCPEARITIEGFTDPKGDPDINLALSWKRANTVLNTIKSGGFSDQSFAVKSHMQKHNDAICPHWDVVDRRVEFVVTQVN